MPTQTQNQPTKTDMSRFCLLFFVGALCLGVPFVPPATATQCPITAPGHYNPHPHCNPVSVKESVTCDSLPPWVPIGGGLYGDWGMYFNVMGSRYYFARVAEALGFHCPTDRAQMEGMDLMTPWSAIYGAIALDGANGFDRVYLKRCVFPIWAADDPDHLNPPIWPFLCTGAPGNPRTCGPQLGTLSYYSILHDEVNHDWNVFAHCWNPKTPQNPDAEPTAVSYNVFSTKKTLPPADRELIIQRLIALGFDTSADNLIEPDFSS